MQIFVHKAKDGHTLTFEVEGDWTVARLKEAVEGHEHGIPAELQMLLFQAMEMLGERTLADYNIHKESELKLIERVAAPQADEQGTAAVEIARIEGMGDGMCAGWVELTADKRALDEAQKALVQANGGGKLKKKLKLNVGGTIFKNVKRETLCVVVDSNLAKLFSGRWEGRLQRDSKRNVYLDLPSECFGEILTFLSDRKLRPDDPIVLPSVPEEQEPIMFRLLNHLGLGHLFVDEEGEPPQSAEPEPEAEVPAEPAEAVGQGLPEQERELIVDENEDAKLPPRSVKVVISARFGSLAEDGKWIDVTRLIADQVDDQGGLELLRVSPDTFGRDPAPEAENKQLSIKYKPSDPWERESFEDALTHLKQVAEAERSSLRRERKIQRDRELDLEDEKRWVQCYLKAEGRQPDAPELVEMSVGAIGERLCVKRSTLTLCPESALARRFDAAVWDAAAGGGNADGTANFNITAILFPIFH